MMYLMLVIFAMIIGLLRGGELERLYHVSIDGVYFFAAALLLRGMIWFLGIVDLSTFLGYSSILLILSYLILTIASIANLRVPGFKYITLGVLLNFFVIIVNGGRMPVLINEQIAQDMNANVLLEQGQNMIHSLRNSDTMFAFLGDVIPLPKTFPDSSILSVGDLMIFIGLFVFIQKIMLQEEA